MSGYEGRFAAGDRDAGERLLRWDEREIAAMTIRRVRLVEALATLDARIEGQLAVAGPRADSAEVARRADRTRLVTLLRCTAW